MESQTVPVELHSRRKAPPRQGTGRTRCHGTTANHAPGTAQKGEKQSKTRMLSRSTPLGWHPCFGGTVYFETFLASAFAEGKGMINPVGSPTCVCGGRLLGITVTYFFAAVKVLRAVSTFK